MYTRQQFILLKYALAVRRSGATRWTLALLCWCTAMAPVSVLFAAEPLAPYTIGYLQLKRDTLYSKKRTRAQFLTQPNGRPYIGAKVGLKESRFHGMAAGVEFKLKRVKARSTEQLIESVKRMAAEGVQFIIADLPADTLASLSSAVRDQAIVLLNISAAEDALRQGACQPVLYHVTPSHAMLMDGLTQYLVERKWRKVLLLEGQTPADKLLANSFMRSVKRYGLKVVKRLPFELGNDPRRREKNNIQLLTAVKDHDVIMVADTDGEFARDVPYQSQRPRLVVGTEGMAALAWHWAWERHGAPQLEKRFEAAAGRAMKGRDWSAWLAVKIIAEAVQRTKSVDFTTLKAYVDSQQAVFDGFKGNRSSFRRWNNQLRQPVLLATHNWVVSRAPIEGFLHKENTLDTLGFDERDSLCEF